MRRNSAPWRAWSDLIWYMVALFRSASWSCKDIELSVGVLRYFIEFSQAVYSTMQARSTSF